MTVALMVGAMVGMTVVLMVGGMAGTTADVKADVMVV
jgi:hypothetical protein